MQTQFASRDRLAARLAQLARMLEQPTPANIEKARAELNRLATG